MTVDAMELLYTEKPDAFGIVSSDADFTPLVMHLRAKGAAVYGFGAEQTPRLSSTPARASCISMRSKGWATALSAAANAASWKKMRGRFATVICQPCRGCDGRACHP